MKTEDNIEIELKDIVKLQELYINIFAEKDEDYPDYRRIKKKEQAKQRILDRITNDKEKQQEIWLIIKQGSWDITDLTFKPICDLLRAFGYKIINDEGGVLNGQKCNDKRSNISNAC